MKPMLIDRDDITVCVDLDFFLSNHELIDSVTIPLPKWNSVRGEIDKMNSDFTFDGQQYFGTMSWWTAIKKHGSAPPWLEANPSISIYVDDTAETKEAIQSIQDITTATTQTENEK